MLMRASVLAQAGYARPQAPSACAAQQWPLSGTPPHSARRGFYLPFGKRRAPGAPHRTPRMAERVAADVYGAQFRWATSTPGEVSAIQPAADRCSERCTTRAAGRLPY